MRANDARVDEHEQADVFSTVDADSRNARSALRPQPSF
jgi:hypothetical protein